MQERASPYQFRRDLGSGIPAYRQIIDQVLGGIAAGALRPGDQLPTVRQMAVDLAINPNTVVRAYRELEIRGVLTTQQGIGTFVTRKQVAPDEAERQRQLNHLVAEFMSRVGAAGFTAAEVVTRIHEFVEQGRPA